jgi:hypothetical protein
LKKVHTSLKARLVGRDQSVFKHYLLFRTPVPSASQRFRFTVLMASRKRARQDEDIQIKVASGEPVAAESFVLRALCSCARALPADAEQWDISAMLCDGQPFTYETVSCWLQCGYRNIYGTAAELDSDSISVLSTVTGLTQVLAFAHAVGSFEGMLQAACSQLQQLQFAVQLPEQVLELPLVGYTYCFQDSEPLQLMQRNLQKQGSLGTPLASAEQRCDVQQQVAKQLSALLQLAHVLRLQPLLDVLHRFIKLNVQGFGTPLLSGVTGSVFSDAVFESALGSSTLSKEAYVSSVLSQPCSLTPGSVGINSLLKPIGRAPTADAFCHMYDAELLQDFAGGRAGDTVSVTVALDPTCRDYGGGAMRIWLADRSSAAGSVFLPVQLLVGQMFVDAAGLEVFLKPESRPAEAAE